jgi:colicin import membrane protein
MDEQANNSLASLNLNTDEVVDNTVPFEVEAVAPVAEVAVAAEKKAVVVTPPTAEKAAKIWSVASAISQANGRPALLHEVTEKLIEEGSDVGQGTIGAQYTRWCIYFGVTKEMRKALRAKLDPKAAEKAEKAAQKVAEKAAAKKAKAAEKVAAKETKAADKIAADASALAEAEEARQSVDWNKLPDDFNLGTIG